MIAVILLGLLFVVVASAVIFGLGVDSRDSRFSLWPLYRAAPDGTRRGDAKRREALRMSESRGRYTNGSTIIPARLDAVHRRVRRGAPGRPPVHAHRTAQCRRVGGRAMSAASPTRPGHDG